MVRVPCCENMGMKKGPWTPGEDQILISYIQLHGHENWRALPKQAGLLRCGKSCRLRWTNYLRPDIKRGNFSKEEEEIIIKLHQILGNRWSTMATRLPGRTDNEIKNFWHTHLKKRLKQNMGNTIRHSTTDIPMPLSFSNQLRLQSSEYASTSIEKFYKIISSPETSMVTKNRSLKEEKKNQFLQEATMETKNDNSSIVNDDMVFWYELFVKAGDSNNS